MRECQFIYDLRISRLNNKFVRLWESCVWWRLSRELYKTADINAMWQSRNESRRRWKFRREKKERERERIRNRAEISPFTAIFETHLACTCPSPSCPSVQRASEHVCTLLDLARISADLTLNRMISSGRQSGRRLDTSHRRAGRDRRRMEIGETERRSPASADPGLGAAARRQSRRRHGRPGNVVLRARRSACGILEHPCKYDFRILLRKIQWKEIIYYGILIDLSLFIDYDVAKLRNSREYSLCIILRSLYYHECVTLKSRCISSYIDGYIYSYNFQIYVVL